MRTHRHPWVLVLVLLTAPVTTVAQPPMVTKYLHEFDTLGSGHPNDLINDQPALLKAAAFFQARGGYGTLLLENGEYIVGLQQLHWNGSPLPGPDWTALEYPSGLDPSDPKCPPLVAVQPGFTLEGCAQFTIQGGANTTVRYRDCLYYGTFLRTPGTDEVFSAAGVDSCKTCLHQNHTPGLLHADVGTMFSFNHCDSITVRDLELNGNIDGALLGGRSSVDGIQTWYDGIVLYESSNCEINNVAAHHFGRDGLMLHGTYADTLVPFATVYPDLHVGIDPADSSTTPGKRTVLFNNRVLNCRFNWNGRQGFSWTALAGLTMHDCDLNYNGAGRMASKPGSGLDIEGKGGQLRVRHGMFTKCRFLHNRAVGITAFDNPCLGQQDFHFTGCVVKAGLEGTALLPSARQMAFDSCDIYGNVGRFFERPENLLDTAFDLVFRNTDFYEEDDQWAYISWTESGLHDTTNCVAGPHMFRFTKNLSQSSRVTFDHCGFYTNCRAVVRFYGRETSYAAFPYCAPCDTCGPTSGPCIGCDSPEDRFIFVTNCTFVNTGRSDCDTLTEVFSGKHTLVDSLTSFTIPDHVRGGLPSDQYEVAFGNCAPYCSGYTIDTIPMTVFPACKPFFYLQDTVTHWNFCDPANNVLMQPCSSDANCYSLTVIPDSAFASLVGDVFIGTVNIKGRFFVDVDVLFQNAEVRLEPGAEIIVQNGWTLDIENSSFTACNGVMWKSITAEDGATVRIRGSFLDDAESAVSALDGSTVWIDGTQFHNNRVGVCIPDVGLPYNNVACWVSNSTFYSAGAMPVPYPGQTTAVGDRGFAAFEVHRTTLDLAGGQNILHTLSNGIVAHQSDVQVSACRMQGIQPDSAYTLTGNGAGIYARGDQGFHFLRQQGYGMVGTPSFDGCRWGIYAEYMNVYSTDNNMLDMGTGHRVERSGYRYVDILNNAVTAHRHGMELRANDGAAHILVEGNAITFGDHPCANCKGYSGILVTEGNQQAHDARILNNSIHFTNAPTSRFGIALTAADAWLVADNTVLMVSNAHNRTGIQLEGCRATEVSCNNISSSDNTYPKRPTGSSSTAWPTAPTCAATSSTTTNGRCTWMPRPSSMRKR
ncbi:MAG: right-handed parallel beta-helix repeat-containing protein [Flavobacteriales bacterium]|nr:right-handed parallel beta-helix repeat-containing protein [Flavobacteriales bacterium]